MCTAAPIMIPKPSFYAKLVARVRSQLKDASIDVLWSPSLYI
eukprot:SAG11_NODE_42799_length_175_cov_12.684211_1_plen_41_part_10